MDLFQTKITDGELKRFGFVFGPLAMAISIWQASRGHWMHVYILAPAGFYAFVCSFLNPRWIFPLRWVLETAFKLLMWSVTHVVLALCFYLVFTPIGLVMRLMRKDLLNQKLDVCAKTYWSECHMQGFEPEHYRKQF